MKKIISMLIAALAAIIGIATQFIPERTSDEKAPQETAIAQERPDDEAKTGRPANDRTSTTHPEELACPIYETSRGGQRISRVGYTLSYDADYKTPQWVGWTLTAEKAEGTVPREKNFYPDPDVRGAKAYPKDYTNSGYDRGHMAPAGDMKWSQQAMLESFGSPTRLAVAISRSYQRDERKLSVHADSKDGGSGEAVKVKPVIPTQGVKSSAPIVKPNEPAADAYVDIIEEIRREKAAEEGIEYKPIFFKEDPKPEPEVEESAEEAAEETAQPVDEASEDAAEEAGTANIRSPPTRRRMCWRRCLTKRPRQRRKRSGKRMFLR